jgi:hypothetical protein
LGWLGAAMCLGCGDPAREPTGTASVGVVTASTDGGDTTTAPDATSSGDDADSSVDSTDDGGSTLKLDVGDDAETDAGCGAAQDICCLAPGELPPHALLDAFLAAYPPAAIPTSIDAVQAFAPSIDAVAMAWSDENVGGELVDAANGGVVDANLDAGRTIARETALAALPEGAVVVDTRDEPPLVVSLGGPAPCDGVGWAWGSVLYRAEDASIGELVYLYVGFCADPFAEGDTDDTEVFYYSEQATQICAPPG